VRGEPPGGARRFVLTPTRLGEADRVVDLPSRATADAGARNPLFMKLSRGPSDGHLKIRWARSPGTPADRAQARVAADGLGGVYASGAFQESLAFEGGGPTLKGAGGNDGFIARYDDDGAEFRTAAKRAAALVSYGPSGSVRWAHIFGAGATFALAVGVAPSGQVYVTGELEGAADLDGDGKVDLPAPKNRGGFVARFGADGVLAGAWSIPTPAMLGFAPDGDVILGGIMGGPMERPYGPADFNGDGRPDIALKGGGPTGAWVARYSPAGERRWVRSYALEMPADLEVRGEIIALSGNYKGVRDLDEDGTAERVDRTVDPALESDLAIMLLSSRDGRPVHVWTAPGPGNDWANAVAFLPNEPALLVTGSIQLTADFTGDGETGEGWIVCENLGDLFVAQYRVGEVGRGPR